MSTLRNKVQLIGNVGNNPEIKTFENDKKVAKFSLATPATSEIFNDGNPHELWIGGPCLAIREDVYYDFIEESLK